MAPFKLKFRMGSSRSTSQEHDPDPQVNEALLGAQQQQEQQQQHQHQEQQQQQQQQQQQHHQAAASSSSTLDSADCSSLGSMSSERKLLLPPNKTSSSSVLNSNSLRLGYINQSRTPCINESPTDTDTANLPTTPPPSYEHVLEENTRLSQHQRQLSTDSAATPNQNSRRSSANSSRHSAAQLSAALEQHLGSVGGGGGGSSGGSSICNDPDCHQNINQNYGNCGSGHLIASNNNSLHNNNNNEGEHQQIIEGVTELELHSDNGDYDCQEVDNTLSVSEFLLETEMATATSGSDDKGFGETGDGQCTDAQCTQCGGEDGCNRNDNGENESVVDGEEGGGASTSSHAARQSFYDPLLNRGNYGNYSETASTKGASSSGQACQEACCAQGSASGLGRRQQQHQQQQQQATCHSNLLQSPEMMSNKTSKEIYKDLAKQWGITCKMSESCRCMECQSHYFDCDYDDNEHQKTDGGLGAGTPMFISEVMHGSGCNIL